MQCHLRSRPICEESVKLQRSETHSELLFYRGIPGISKNREARLEAIANQLVTGPDEFDFVFLQEVWSKSDFLFLEHKVSSLNKSSVKHFQFHFFLTCPSFVPPPPFNT